MRAKAVILFCIISLALTPAFLRAAATHPKAEQAYQEGFKAAMHGNYARAAERFAVAARLDPGYAQAYNAWGLALSNMSKQREALDKYKKATETDPSLTKAWYNWGVALSDLNMNREAVEKFRRAVKQDPLFAPAYNGWGLSLVELGRYDEAIGKFKTAARLDPKSAAKTNETIRKLEKLKAEKAKKAY